MMDLHTQREWFDSPAFETEYHTSAPLGVLLSASSTRFSLWAPTAQAVALRLYQDGAKGEALETVSLAPGEKGVWHYEAPKNLSGLYYDYAVTVEGVTRETVDPYARSCGVNGKRGMILDLAATNPLGWDKDVSPRREHEATIYEVHVKDFSWDARGGFPPQHRGKFTALALSDTCLNGEPSCPTGLDYLRRLGVTHLQLMPIYDYGSVNEAYGHEEEYNWGYDPVHYNIPEGSYSTDPYHGEVRVRELKKAVQALHKQGFRVIMDVVYNHTHNLNSPLFSTVPWYFYRQNQDGTASNGSGCGNELASERSMCARYILDSVLYWAEEYHIDGFRFDLMGLLDVPLMNRIQKELDQRYGPGEKLLYGEPWAAAASAVRPGTVLASKDHLRELSPAIGAFCDNTRDAVKGSLMDVKARGFVNGGFLSADYLANCMLGWAMGEKDAPSQTISYLSCHDDWTLWDKLVYTLSPRRRFRCHSPNVLRANRMAAAILFCCQGHIFLHAGEEFGRTKDGEKNSYRSSPALNQLDWERAWSNHRLVDYYRGLIQLRKAFPCLWDKTAQASQRLRATIDFGDGCVGVCLDNGQGQKWDRLALVLNASMNPHSVPLPEGTWQVLADETSSFRFREKRIIPSPAPVPPVSALILGRIPSQEEDAT